MENKVCIKCGIEKPISEFYVKKGDKIYKECKKCYIKKISDKKNIITDSDYKYLLFRPCKTKEELRHWMIFFLHIDFPDTTIDPTSNSNPMDAAWNIYRTAVHYDEVPDEEKYLRTIIYAARGSFKSLLACSLEFVIMLHTNRNVVHVGLQQNQARNIYTGYFQKFLNYPVIKENALISSIQERTILKNRFGEEVNLHVIPCTLNATSSLRANLLVFDEIDKAKGESIIAYRNAFGQLTSTNDKKLPIVFAISTRDSSFGVIQEEIDKAHITGTKILHWSILDITEYCPNEKSGIEPVKIYIKNNSLFSITEEQYLKLSQNEMLNYESSWVLENCQQCYLASICRSFLKNQNSKCKWLKTQDSTEKIIKMVSDEDTIISQLLCKKPPTSGLVYSDFSNKNIANPNDIYKMFTGEDNFNNKCMTVEDMIDVFDNYNIPRYMGIDAGYHNPSALLIFIDKNENIYILKEYRPNNVDSPELAQYLYDNWKKYNINMAFVDPESPDCISAIRKKGFNVSSKVDKNVQIGIATVKGFLKVPMTQKTKLFIHEDCEELIKEMSQKYRYKIMSDGSYSDVPEKKGDHSCDSLRYLIHTLFGKSRGNLTNNSILSKKEITEKDIIKHQLDPNNVAKIGYGRNAIIIDNRKEIEKEEDNTKKTKKNSAFDFTKF